MPPKESHNPHILIAENVAVDLSVPYEVCGDDEPYILKMVETFLKNMPGTLMRMENALQQKNWNEVYQAAHFAKSSLSIIKVTDMLESAKTIEMSARRKENLDIIAGKIELMKQKFSLAERLLAENYKL